MALLVCAGAAVVLVDCLIPSDVERYWLARAGSWSLAHGRILESLHGSWYPNRPWVDQEWLVAIVTAWTRTHGLYVLLELLFAASLIFGIAFVAAECIRTKTHPLVALAQVTVTAIGATYFAQDRAQTLVWAFFPAVILAWRKMPWVTVPLLALWANVHGSFPVAIVWMLLHLDRKRIAPLIAAALATLANPLGWRLWIFTIVLARNASLERYVNEWTPALQSYTGIIVMLLALAPLWIRLGAGIRFRRPIRYGDLVFTVAFALGTLLAARYAMLLFLSSATTLGDAFRARAKPMPLATRAVTIVFAIIILLTTWQNFARARVFVDPWFGNLERNVDFARCAPSVQGKRTFTDALEAGSLIEMAGGTANVDGRIDAFPIQAIEDASTVLNNESEAISVIAHNDPQVLALKGKVTPPPREWRLARRCNDVRIYVRRETATSS
jgi:hypothetical protein